MAMVRWPATCRQWLGPIRSTDQLALSIRSIQDHVSYLSSYTTWSGAGSQDELMHSDECIIVDVNDNIVGHASKYDTHRFTREQPEGILHRAFSVFLFDESNRLLLQQRAASKITFPEVWTNTCCSHPLYGYNPTEVDEQNDIVLGSVPGIKRAARRKLEHELGILPEQVDLASMQYLTRLHYCAGDDDQDRTPTGWGEHEMDYILFLRANVDLNVNPEEVMAMAYVTQPELEEMMSPSSGLKWSPWFRIIAREFLPRWWTNIDRACTGDPSMKDLLTIHHLTV